MSAHTKVQIRVPAEQLALWREAAHVRRLTLSEWMRRVLTAAAETTIKEQR